MELIHNLSVGKSEEVDRPLADFPVNIWEDPLTTFSVLDLDSERNKEKLRSLKETVMESLMASRENPIENIKFIDSLCRLGVSYHFEHEIFMQLEAMFGCHDFIEMIRDNESGLYTVALVFQVFRQFGYKLATDVFDKFKNKDGEFKEHLAEDARGLLCLYEAAQWSTHGEDILDEALVFSRSLLEDIASRSSPHLAVRIKNALKHAYPRGISRIETRQYISYYEKEDFHDQTLLEFAKVDFNLLQLLYREELGQVFRWYNNLNLESKLPYARNRTVESYLWAVGVHFEPCYSEAGIKFATLIIVLTLVDDTYDAYGTIEELEPFTDALLRWNPSGIEGLPESMKYIHCVVLEFFDKLEEEMEKEGRPGYGIYAKKSFEHKRKHIVTAIDCYMKQYGVSWEEAREEIKVMASDSWKTINQELMTKPCQFSFPVVMRFLNLSRVMEVFYKKTGIFTQPELMKDYVVSLFLDKIPI
ncbi:Alpha-humulene/(-)-(E)-beta-caryophyllene synthase [Cardamine amara subsp. amara]|uniref:Alpha-humulene/(-)-(E)-beta-caryophyllene synthase n=1 Tax=Cardamine amara subsp. amara TaxID=228776 RepID=A0ABD1BJC4_CARAN